VYMYTPFPPPLGIDGMNFFSFTICGMTTPTDGARPLKPLSLDHRQNSGQVSQERGGGRCSFCFGIPDGRPPAVSPVVLLLLRGVTHA
jgi:hypothetical protein